jgi:hypothetical protein
MKKVFFSGKQFLTALVICGLFDFPQQASELLQGGTNCLVHAWNVEYPNKYLVNEKI